MIDISISPVKMCLTLIQGSFTSQHAVRLNQTLVWFYWTSCPPQEPQSRADQNHRSETRLSKRFQAKPYCACSIALRIQSLMRLLDISVPKANVQKMPEKVHKNRDIQKRIHVHSISVPKKQQ